MEELEVKYKSFLTEDAIKAYSSMKRVSRQEAKEMLIKSFEFEENHIDIREIALKAMKGIRLLSPKTAGLELREKDTILEIKKLKSQVSSLKAENEKITQLLEELVKEKLKPKKEYNPIKWILNLFKSLLPNKETS